MLKISHIQCRVNNIKVAVNNFEQADFQVEWSRNPKNSLNAFIWFEKDPFIELFEMKRFMIPIGFPLGLIYGASMRTRWMKWMTRHEGLIDFTLEGSNEEMAKQENINVLRRDLNYLGISTSKVLNGRRKKPYLIFDEFVHYPFLQKIITPLVGTEFILSENLLFVPLFRKRK